MKKEISIQEDNFLHKYFLSNPGKILYKWFHYFDIYERHLKRFRGTSPVMLEIGVFKGGSMEMWKEYFGHGCQIIGIDIDPDCKKHESKDVEIFIGSQDDPEIINNIFSKYPKIDIVLDDGSHQMHHMISSFELMYDRLNPNGVYMVEDTHTCYWKEYGGSLRKDSSFIEFAKKKIDEINATHTRGALPITRFTQSTDYISFYDSLVVFERRKQSQRQTITTKGMQTDFSY